MIIAKNFTSRLLAVVLTGAAVAASDVTAAEPPQKILGMYVHQHWAYNHPYAARTWTLQDWEGYLDGISKLGYNMVLIWPMLETMPDPLTPSDEANLRKIARVIDLAHEKFKMRAAIVWCPNVAPRSEEARKYTFEERPFFHTDERIDPADPVAFGKLMAWRKKITAPLARTDAVFIIDSDPGGYPGSTNLDFVYLLGAHRRMLDELRPGIEVVYWSHFGWESYSRFYSTGELKRGEPAEPREAVAMFAEQPRSEPWSVANSGFPDDFLDPLNLGDRVLSFPYGAIEGEPSFPFTQFNGPRLFAGAAREGARGVLGNSQTHCIQLPNTFAFARKARGLPTERADYVKFANELIPGYGADIVEGWEALQGQDGPRIRAAIARVNGIPDRPPTGELKGLLFGDPGRFVGDLVAQLEMAAALYDFRMTLSVQPRDERRVRATLGRFVTTVEKWQGRHGYTNHWHWGPMFDALKELNDPDVNRTLATRTWTSEEGATPFERVKNGLARMESFTARLIAAMRRAAGAGGKPDGAATVFKRERPEWEIPFRNVDPYVMSVMPGESQKTYFDPLLKRDIKWEQDVFCPTFAIHDNRLYCVYRAYGEDEQWRMGLAWSTDGINFTRAHKPVFHARPEDEFLGDLRNLGVASVSYGDSRMFADDEGNYYLFFNYFSHGHVNVQELAIATTRDFKHWKMHGRAFRKVADRDRDVIPELTPRRFPHPAIVTQLKNDRFVVKKIKGRYWMYLNVHTPNRPSNFCMAVSDNMLDWEILRNESGQLVHPMTRRPGMFDSRYMDTTAAVVRDDGILLIYNGINAEPHQEGDPRLQLGAHYPAQALFAVDEPFRLLKRSDSPFKGGNEQLEAKPQVFWYAPLYESWSLIPWKGELLLYWNHNFGRRAVGLWKAPIPDSMRNLRPEARSRDRSGGD